MPYSLDTTTLGPCPLILSLSIQCALHGSVAAAPIIPTIIILLSVSRRATHACHYDDCASGATGTNSRYGRQVVIGNCQLMRALPSTRKKHLLYRQNGQCLRKTL